MSTNYVVRPDGITSNENSSKSVHVRFCSDPTSDIEDEGHHVGVYAALCSLAKAGIIKSVEIRKAPKKEKHTTIKVSDTYIEQRVGGEKSIFKKILDLLKTPVKN